jgi:hypothetical protein
MEVTGQLYPQGKNPSYPLGGPQSRSGRGDEEKNPHHSPRRELNLCLQPVGCLYTDRAISNIGLLQLHFLPWHRPIKKRRRKNLFSASEPRRKNTVSVTSGFIPTAVINSYSRNTIFPVLYCSVLALIVICTNYSCMVAQSVQWLGYGMDNRSSIPGRGWDFFLIATTSRSDLGPTQPPFRCVPGAPSPRLRGLGVKLTTYLHLPQRLIMCGAIPPLLQFVFMTWCLIKKLNIKPLPIRWVTLYWMRSIKEQKRTVRARQN